MTDVNSPTPQGLNDASVGNHHEWLGFDVTHVEPGRVTARLAIRPDHLNPMGGLHGGVTASLADSLCGYGVHTQLPEGAAGFATIGLSANYLGRAGVGDDLEGTATLVHGGRTLQTWDVTVTSGGRPVAVVRVTQLITYPTNHAGGS